MHVCLWAVCMLLRWISAAAVLDWVGGASRRWPVVLPINSVWSATLFRLY